MSERNWSDEILSRVDGLVDTVHDKAVIPVVTVIRGVVYGVIIAFMLAVVAVLLTVGLVRLLSVYLPGDIWAVYALLGGLFVLVGLFLWRLRKPKKSK